MNFIHKLFIKYIHNESIIITLILCLSILISVFQTNAISFITAKIIEGIHHKSMNIATSYFNYFIIASIIFILILFSYKYIQNLLFTKLPGWLRGELLKLILLHNDDEFSSVNFIKLISPINRIVGTAYNIFYRILVNTIPDIAFLLVISMYFIYKIPFFGVSFLVANICLFIFFYMIWDNIAEERDSYEINANENEKYMIDILNNMDKIVYRGNAKTENKIYENKLSIGIEKAVNFYSNIDKYLFILTVANHIILFLSISYLIKSFFDKKITTTTFITFFTILLLYRDKMEGCFDGLIEYIEFIGKANYVINDFSAMMSDYDKPLEDKIYQSVNLPFHRLKFENISFKYATSDKPVYEDLNMTLDTNDKIIGITGLSGRGKSTFIKLLLKMYKPSKGTIYIDGCDIKDIDSDYIRKNITYVNQNSKLFDTKILDNILYGCADMDACNGHLEEIMRYPKIKELYKNIDIYNHNAGALGENLSGGQRQIINIIGGLVNPCKILVLDEPTNALDRELKMELLEMIKYFKQYKNCIMIITHDKDVYPLFSEQIDI